MQFQQAITIDHPPTTLTPMQTLLPQQHGIAVDIVPHESVCTPAKNITISDKVYEALAPYDQCPTHNWKDDGCRVISRGTMTVHNVVAMKPTFETFPVDATITTEDSYLPAATGTPAGHAYCSTPFDIYYTDAEPVATTAADSFCGWTIARTWTIRPVYKDCTGATPQGCMTPPCRPDGLHFGTGVPRSSELSTDRVQLLLVRDATPPQFSNVLTDTVRVPFFANYQDSSLIPIVEDMVTSSHATSQTYGHTEAQYHNLSCGSHGFFAWGWFYFQVCSPSPYNSRAVLRILSRLTYCVCLTWVWGLQSLPVSWARLQPDHACLARFQLYQGGLYGQRGHVHRKRPCAVDEDVGCNGFVWQRAHAGAAGHYRTPYACA